MRLTEEINDLMERVAQFKQKMEILRCKNIALEDEVRELKGTIAELKVETQRQSVVNGADERLPLTGVVTTA